MVSHWTNNSGNATNGDAGSLHLCWGTTLTTSGQRKSPSYPLARTPYLSHLLSSYFWPNMAKLLAHLVQRPLDSHTSSPNRDLFFCTADVSGPKQMLQSRALTAAPLVHSLDLHSKASCCNKWIQIRWVWFIFTLQYNSVPCGRDRTVINWWYVRWQVIIHSISVLTGDNFVDLQNSLSEAGMSKELLAWAEMFFFIKEKIISQHPNIATRQQNLPECVFFFEFPL